MTLSKSSLAEYMAFLLAIPPESNLAKLLKFCLAAKLGDRQSDKNALEVCQMLMENPDDLPYWIQEIMGSDREYSPEELAAFGEMKLRNTEEFIQTLWQELENLDLGNKA